MFKSVFVEGQTIDDVWFKTLIKLCTDGRVYRIDSGSFAGDFRLEFDFVAGTIHKPIQYTEGNVRLPLAVTVPQGCPAPTTDHDIEQYFVNYLMDSELEDNEHYRYSTFIVGGEYHIPEIKLRVPFVKAEPHHHPITIVPNQLQFCIDHFKEVGFGNAHCAITVGYPESQLAYLVPYKTEMDRQTSPCMRLIDMKIINDNGENYLCFNTYFRSWDLYGGFPVNIGGLSLLMEYVAGELGVKTGSLSFCSKSLHVYGHAIEALMARTGNDSLLKKIREENKDVSS